MNLEFIRKQIPVTSRRAYFDNAGTGPPPIPVLNTLNEFIHDWKEYGEDWEEWLPSIIESRRLFGKLVGASSTDEIANIPNVTTGLIGLSSSYKYKKDGNIVVSSLNFPTNIYNWHLQKSHGRANEVRLLKPNANGIIPMEDWECAIDDNTSIVSVDYVSWKNGCREKISEIARIAHDHGALMIGDAFHGLGVFPVNVRDDGVDALLAGTYKWLQAPHGTAYMYVRHDQLGMLDPNYAGWHSVKDSVVARYNRQQDMFATPFDLEKTEPSTSATQFEWGTWGVISVMGAKAALEWALRDDMRDRYHHILKITGRLIEGLKEKERPVLSPLQTERRSGIVVIDDPEPASTYNKLKSQNIIVASRVNSIRVSPHYYNSEDEIDRLLMTL